MAGEWIKVEKATPDKPEVLRMARELCIDRDAVFGKLMLIWMWFDANSVDGVVDGAVDADVDALVRMTGFASVMRSVGWLFDKPDEDADPTIHSTYIPGLALPNFDRHNGETAKKRALRNDRQAKWRSKSVDVYVDTNVDTTSSTKASTREEKRREEVKAKNNVGQKPDLKPLSVEVLNFLNIKTGRRYEPVPANLSLIAARLREGASVDDLRAVVAKKCRDWGGDPKMNEYLRPKTLFNATNYAQYRGELVAVEAE
jgi:uncharacterized phage protein (TIGR02220 family)